MTFSFDATTQPLLGSATGTAQRLHGGDLSDVYLLTLEDGREVVAKIGPRVATEGRMLQTMAQTGAPVPAVLGCNGTTLLIQALPETSGPSQGWASLGNGLRILHAHTGPHLDWDENYAFVPVTIANTPSQDWPAFWAEHRLLAGNSDIPADLANRLEALCLRLPELLPQTPHASLLHGDLWSGNVLFIENGAYLIDPACYYGDGEVDLATLHLFGSPSSDFSKTYGDLPPGTQERRPIYQLWPALVHLRLFGQGYRSLVERFLAQAGF